jgi:glycerophosphoryl diester phosphodiesterase
LVKSCQEKNFRLIPWTVNTLSEWQRLKNLGVDGIISDYPDLFKQLK